jgi:hypothetical protein
MAALQDGNLLAGRGQIARGRKPVVTGADHNDVVHAASRGELLERRYAGQD